MTKYDRRIPRYTSYPTTSHFHAGIDAAAYERWLGELSSERSVSLYLHAPLRPGLFCGCRAAAAREHRPAAGYADLLVREIELVADALGKRFSVSHVHWGGGTSAMLAPDEWRRITTTLRDRFDVLPSAEIAVEVDPRELGLAAIGALAASGVTRATVGVQSFEETERAVRRLRQAGIRRVNVDLMYGSPQQTAEAMARTVEQALALRPDRVALYEFVHAPPIGRRRAPEGAAPDAEERRRQRQCAADRLVKTGFVPIGLDNFARPDDPLAISLAAGTLHRNFQGYTTDDAAVLLGIGASSIGSLPQGYVQNAVPVPAYAAAIRDGRLATARGVALDDDDRLRREIIERLMCDLAVDVDAVCARHRRGAASAAFAPEFAALDALTEDGLARREGARVVVTEAGRSLLHTVCAVFDRHLGRGVGTAPAADPASNRGQRTHG